MNEGHHKRVGKTFLFYFRKDRIKVCPLREGKIALISSNNYRFISFNSGLVVYSDRDDTDFTSLLKDGIYAWPQDIADCKVTQDLLCIAGGDDISFKAAELEVLGVEFDKNYKVEEAKDDEVKTDLEKVEEEQVEGE